MSLTPSKRKQKSITAFFGKAAASPSASKTLDVDAATDGKSTAEKVAIPVEEKENSNSNDNETMVIDVDDGM